MKIIVVEPHPDDAFLSLGWHLEKVWRDHLRTVVTVFHDDKRGREGKEYARSIGAGWIGLNLPESKMDSSADDIRPVKELRKLVDKIKGKWVFPFGLQHPDHLRVAATCPDNAWSYLEHPYLSKMKLAGDVVAGIEECRWVSTVFPPARKFRHESTFKSQAKFFYFNQDIKQRRLPEIIVQKPSPLGGI